MQVGQAGRLWPYWRPALPEELRRSTEDGIAIIPFSDVDRAETRTGLESAQLVCDPAKVPVASDVPVRQRTHLRLVHRANGAPGCREDHQGRPRALTQVDLPQSGYQRIILDVLWTVL